MRRTQRSTTLTNRQLTKRESALGLLLYPPGEDLGRRPATRAGCASLARPCVHVSCHHNLYLDVNPRSGSIKLNFPDLEPEQMGCSCALDVADNGPATLDKVGEAMNLTRERIRQIEVKAMARAKLGREGDVLREFAPVGSETRRRLPVLADEEE